jgi:hypothetical protein
MHTRESYRIRTFVIFTAYITLMGVVKLVTGYFRGSSVENNKHKWNLVEKCAGKHQLVRDCYNSEKYIYHHLR